MVNNSHTHAELVKRLRYAAENPTLSNMTACFTDVSVAKQAADALERLSETGTTEAAGYANGYATAIETAAQICDEILGAPSGCGARIRALKNAAPQEQA